MNQVQHRIIQWLANGSTGVSSKMMAYWIGFGVMPDDYGHPYDPADQALPHRGAQAGPVALADRLHALVGVFGDVPFVHDDSSAGHQLGDQVAVRPPHVHRDHANGIQPLHADQPAAHGVPVSIRQQVDQGPLLDVGQHASGMPEQVDLIDAQDARCRHAVVSGVQLGFRPVLEDAANGTLVQTGVAGHGCEGLGEATVSDPVVQASGDLEVLVEVGTLVGTGLPAQQFPAAEPLALPFDGDRLSSHRQIHVGHKSRAVRRDGFRAAMRAAGQLVPASKDTNGDGVFGFDGVARDQALQVQNVQEGGAP